MEQPTSGLTKIQVWNNQTVVYKHNFTQDKSKLGHVIVTMFQLFKRLLREEQCKQWTKIQVHICDHKWQDHNGVTQQKNGVTWATLSMCQRQ